MKTYIVYAHTFPNDKRYIGITCNKPEWRWNGGMGYRRQPVLYNAIIKYGWDNVLHEIMAENLLEDEAKAMEIELIANYRTQNHLYGYNGTAGGDGKPGCVASKETRSKLSDMRRGKHLSEEAKSKISESLKGRQKSEETRLKLSEINKGKHPSDESRAKNSEAHKGMRHSEESYAKQSESMKGKTHTAEAKLKMSLANDCYKKRMYQYTAGGELVKVWDSLTAAMNGLTPDRVSSGIHNCVAGRAKRAYGFRWTYEITQSEVEK